MTAKPTTLSGGTLNHGLSHVQAEKVNITCDQRELLSYGEKMAVVGSGTASQGRSNSARCIARRFAATGKIREP